MKRTGRQMKASVGREPDHKHPAWETNEKKLVTNEKKWETNKKKWETSRPGTRPQAEKKWKTNERKCGSTTDLQPLYAYASFTRRTSQKQTLN